MLQSAILQWEHLLVHVKKPYPTIESPNAERMLLSKPDFNALDTHFRVAFFNSLQGYKTPFLCGSLDSEGRTNLALFSSILHIGANPAALGILFRPHTVPRHTLENILQTGFFTLNSVQPEFVENAHETIQAFPAEVSEFDACRIPMIYKKGFKAPFVESSIIQIGLHLEEKVELQFNQTILVVGRIELVDVPDTFIQKNGFIDMASANVLAVQGLEDYFLPEFHRRFEKQRG